MFKLQITYTEWHSFLWFKGQNFLRGFGNLLVRTEARRMKIFMAFSKDGWVTKIPPHSYGGMMRQKLEAIITVPSNVNWVVGFLGHRCTFDNYKKYGKLHYYRSKQCQLNCRVLSSLHFRYLEKNRKKLHVFS